MYERNPQQVAQHFSRQWGYFERNIQALGGMEKIKVITFFKALKELTAQDLSLLAERYYKSKDFTKFNELVGDYSSVRPVPFDVIADNIGQSPKDVQEKLRYVERKLGEAFIRLEATAEREQAIDNINRLAEVTIDLLRDQHEKEILAKAFQEIASYRQNKKQSPDGIDLVVEMRKLKTRGY